MGLSIGIDATTWWNKRGFGRFTRSLVGAMLSAPRGHHFTLFIDRPPEPEMMRANVSIVQVDTSATVTEAATAGGSRRLTDLLAFRRAVSAVSLDVFWFPAVYSWYPTGGRAPVAITFHDAIAEHYSSLVLPHWRGRLLWNAKTWLARRSARCIVTVSEAARDEIVDYLHVARSSISVVLEAADECFALVAEPALRAAARAELGLPVQGRYLLYVGGIAPHKNLLGLVEGFAQAIGDVSSNDLHLVIAGDPKGDGFHTNTAALYAMAESGVLAGRVHFPGFVPEALLPALYSDALAVVMPAFSEGFGLPAIESIACGTPVLATADGAVSEVVGPAGLFFDPRDPADIARTIRAVAGDRVLEAALRAACRPRAASMSWPRSAAAMLDLLETCAEQD